MNYDERPQLTRETLFIEILELTKSSREYLTADGRMELGTQT